MERNTLTPEMETVLDMMQGLSREGQEKIVDALYDVVSEVDSEERWSNLLTEKPGPMEDLAEMALKEHREKKIRPF